MEWDTERRNEAEIPMFFRDAILSPGLNAYNNPFIG
jgi:hypothetical protein